MVLRDADPNPSRLRLRGCHPLCRAIPGHFGFAREGAVGPFYSTSLNGFPFRFGLGFSPFARRYSGNPILVSFPPPTWMFPFGGFPLPKGSAASLSRQEVPFGDPRIKGCMHLPGAYRSLPRPSSAPEPSHPSGGVARRAYSGTHIRLAFRGLCAAFIASFHWKACLALHP